MYNPSAQPFVRFSFAFAIGIALQDQILSDFDPTWLFYSSVIVCALAALYIHTTVEYVWVSGALILSSLVVMGMEAAYVHNEMSAKTHFSKQTPHPFFIGTITNLPELTASKTKCIFQVEQIVGIDKNILPATGALQLFLPKDSLRNKYQFGDRMIIRCTPNRLAPPLNPDAFDYAAYMHSQNVHYQAFIKPDSAIVLEHDQGSAIWAATYRARERVLLTLAKHFTDPAELGVAEALLVGYKGHLPDELQNAYIETGSMHILAVSGAHVGIIFLGMMFLLRKIPIRHRHWRLVETLILLASIWGFAFLAGMGASIARATVMFSFFLVGRAFRLDYEGYNIIAASAFFLLLYEPFMLFQVSFQLSFLAVLGMMLFYPPLYKLSPLMPKWLDYFWQIFLFGLAAQLGTLPLSLYYFHQFPLYFWLSGLIVVPVASVYMYSAAVLLLVEAVMPALGTLIATPIIWMVKLMNATIYGIQKIPFALIDGIWLRWWEVLVLALATAFIAIQLYKPKGVYLVGISACLCAVSLSHLAKVVLQSQENQIVLYHTGSSKMMLMDVFGGHHLIASGTVGVEGSKAEKFAAGAHRMAMGNKTPDQYVSPQNFKRDEQVQFGQFLHQIGPCLQFGESSFAVLNQAYSFQPNGKRIALEGLIIDTDSEISVELCLAVFSPKVVILSQSVRRKALEEWQRLSAEHHIEVHAIAREGAWVWPKSI
jgi:competence protein ComEC